MSKRRRKDLPAERSSHAAKPPDLRGRLERYWWIVLGVLFAIALAWRLSFIGRLSATPLWGSLPADERIYWDWSTYLMGSGFVGTNPFFLGPLYPHVLAVIRLVVGSELSNILAVQAIWGAAAVVLVTDAARRLVGREIALAAGLLLAFYEMAVFFDGLILMESLILFLEVLLIWLWARAARPGTHVVDFALIGLVTGLVTLGRATGAVLLAPAAWIARANGGVSRRVLTGRLIAITTVFIASVIPATISNWRTSGEFIPITYNFGFNLYVGNHEHATGRSVWISGPKHAGMTLASRPDGGAEADGREYLRVTYGEDLKPGQSSAAWRDRAVAFMLKEPVRVLELAVTKAVLLWNHREVAQFELVALYRRYAGPIGAPIVGTFLVVGTLGLFGAFQAARWTLMGRALQMYVALMSLSILPFFVTDRYRVHLVPALVVLGALAIRSLAELAGDNRGARLKRMILPAAAAVVLVGLPISPGSAALQEWNQAMDLGTRWLDRGRPELAVDELGRAVQLEPLLQAERAFPDAETRAALYFNYAVALRNSGQDDKAIDWFRAAAETAPDNPRFVRTLGDAYLVQGREREGDSLLSRVDALVGATSELLLSKGYQAARERRFADAESLFAEAVSRDVRHYAAWAALLRIQVQSGDTDRALETMARVKKTGMPRHTMNLYEALVLAAAGDNARARELLDSVPAAVTERDPVLRRVRSAAERFLTE